MKRLLLAVIVTVVPAALFAQVADRDMLVTQDGTLYTIESTVNDGSAPYEVGRYLSLTIQNSNERPHTVVVPDSLTAGVHWRPALAYDSDSKTLFVFWLKMPNGMSSELLLASYSDGRWQKSVSIDDQPYHLRFNLRIAITRQVAELQKDGSYEDVPALLVHAVWWDQTGYDEGARYALISINKGVAGKPELHYLNEFASSPPFLANQVDPNFNSEILKHPAFVEAATPDSIDVVFGDHHINAFSRVNIRPIADGRIHIPIGARPGGPRIAAPKSFTAYWPGRISTMPSRDGKLLLYNASSESVSYILYSDGAWSGLKTLPLNDKVSADAVVAALTKMLNQ